MKPKVFKFILPLALLLFCFQLHAESVKRTDYTKSFSKEFDVNKTDKFKVLNKYGEIDIKTWDEPRVKVDVLITVKARSSESADEMLERITIEFDQGDGYTSAMTNIGEKKSSWSSWWSGGSGDDFKIDYTVKIPKQHSLELTNKYGHSYLTDIEGTADFTVKYGDLHAQNIGSDVKLYLGYGSANLGNTGKFNGEIKYAKFRMENAEDVRMECKYSKLTFGDVGDVNMYSGYDNIDIKSSGDIDFEGKYGDLDVGKANRVDVVCKYTNVEIESCAKGGKFELSYGGLRIEELGANFGSLEVDGSYAGIKLGMHPSANYAIDATTRYAGINYPDGLDLRRDIKEGNHREIEGTKGGGGGKIEVTSNYGSVTIW